MPFSFDLSAYAGKQVELSITYISDEGVQGLGVFVDDTKVTADGATLAETSFEDGLGGWTVAGAPEGSDGNANDWISSTSVGYVDGPGVATERHGLLGLRPGGRDRSRHAGDARQGRPDLPRRRVGAAATPCGRRRHRRRPPARRTRRMSVSGRWARSEWEWIPARRSGWNPFESRDPLPRSP